MSKLIDLTGRIFSKLTVIDRAQNNKANRAMWNCLCECGEKTVVSTSDLTKPEKEYRRGNTKGIKGPTKSCGCLTLTPNRIYDQGHDFKRKYSRRESTLMYLYGRHIRGAEDRNWKPLTYDIWITFENQPCHICNKPAELKKQKSGDSVFFHGIDRIDNSKGYIVGNIASCCSDCNFGKKEKTVSHYINHAHQVSNFNDPLNSYLEEIQECYKAEY